MGDILHTRRLRITPLSDQALSDRVSAEDSQIPAPALKEMQVGCSTHPEARLWYTLWVICLEDTGEEVGSLCFHGPTQAGCVELGIGISPSYQRQGYAEEAIPAILSWAFAREKALYCCIAEADPDNQACCRLLEKLRFSHCGAGREGLRYEKERPFRPVTTFTLVAGLVAGAWIGIILGGLTVFLTLGLCLGLAIGGVIDTVRKRKCTRTSVSPS